MRYVRRCRLTCIGCVDSSSAAIDCTADGAPRAGVQRYAADGGRAASGVKLRHLRGMEVYEVLRATKNGQASGYEEQLSTICMLVNQHRLIVRLVDTQVRMTSSATFVSCCGAHEKQHRRVSRRSAAHRTCRVI